GRGGRRGGEGVKLRWRDRGTGASPEPLRDHEFQRRSSGSADRQPQGPVEALVSSLPAKGRQAVWRLTLAASLSASDSTSSSLPRSVPPTLPCDSRRPD